VSAFGPGKTRFRAILKGIRTDMQRKIAVPPKNLQRANDRAKTLKRLARRREWSLGRCFLPLIGILFLSAREELASPGVGAILERCSPA
jgi:hypothetical protein